MKQAREILTCGLLLAAVVLLAFCAQFVSTANRVAANLPGQVQAEIDRTRGELLAEVDKQSTDLQVRATGQIDALRNDTLARVDTALAIASGRVGDTLARVDTALGTVDQVRASLQPALDHVTSITAHADEASGVLLARNGLPAQLLGVTAAAKVTLGQAATTMRTIQEATPDMLATVKKVGDNIDKTTEASAEASKQTAQVMTNFAAATKPLPKWLRVSLQIGGPVAMMGNYMSLMGKTMGWF